MNRAEKYFVNTDRHSRKVALQAQDLLERIPSQPRQTYLDVGCGNGIATLYVAEQTQLNIHFQVADAENLPFPNASFDYVLCKYSIHHIPDWRQAFREMVRVAKPEGHLLFSDLRLPACSGFWINRFRSQLGPFPKQQQVEALAHETHLTQKFSQKRLIEYDIIWQKAS